MVVILAGTLTDREMGFQADNAIFENYEKTISKTTACTLGRKNVDTCQGDSGGPLVTRTKKVKNQSQSRILSSFHIILGYCA